MPRVKTHVSLMRKCSMCVHSANSGRLYRCRDEAECNSRPAEWRWVRPTDKCDNFERRKVVFENKV